MVDSPRVRGVTSLSGAKYVVIKQDDANVAIPLAAVAGTSAAITAQLRGHGIFLIGPAMIDRFVKDVAALALFPEADLADRVGWNRGHFVLPDGKAVSPRGTGEVTVALSASASGRAEAGTLKGWKRAVAKPLIGQPIPMFMLMLPFMPPLLSLSPRLDNFGFELVGRKGVGKSTLQQLAASVVGAPVRGEGPPYWVTWDTTLNGVEDTMPLTADLLLILEEAALFFADETKARRASQFKAFAFKAAAGSTKQRHGTKRSDGGYRFSYLSSSNVPLSELIGDKSEVSSAAADRLLTILIPPDRPHGAFDFVPEGHDSSSALAASLMTGAAANHGIAFRHFLQALVDARQSDETKLRTHIDHYLAQFRRRAEVDPNDGSAIRVADAFGLVYAAGRLAGRFGALPDGFDCGPAVLACYRLHKAGLIRMSFADRLEQIAQRPDTAVIELGMRGLGGKALRAAKAILMPKKRGRLLVIREEHIYQLLPDWSSERRRKDVRALMDSEGGRQQRRVQLCRKGKPERAFVFKLAAEPGGDTEQDE